MCITLLLKNAITTIEVQILVSFADIAILILNKCIEKKEGHKLEFDFEFVEEFAAGSSDETATEECETEYVLNIHCVCPYRLTYQY